MFKQHFAAFVTEAVTILLRKTSPNSARKETFAYAKAMSYL
jgi:hypothetical protein